MSAYKTEEHHPSSESKGSSTRLPLWPAADSVATAAAGHDDCSDVTHAESARTGSFSSVKEDEEGISQSFLVRPRSARADISAAVKVSDRTRLPPACGIPLSGVEAAERANSHVLPAPHGSSVDAKGLDGVPDVTDESAIEPERAQLELLPVEVLENIMEKLARDVPPTELSPRNTDLLACLLTSTSIHSATMNVLYRNITIPHSYVFSKFLGHISKFPELGRLVRRLDLSHFTSIGLGRTREMNREIQNMTSKTLLHCLELTPNLQELLLQEHLDQDLDEAVLWKIFTGLPKLRSLDLCASYAGGFATAFSSVAARASLQALRFGIRNLGLHECSTVQSTHMELLLPRLYNLRILDLYHTRVTGTALNSIPKTARLTHLNLGFCTNITGPEVSHFLKEHPAAKHLVYLNLSCDLACSRLLRASDLDEILPILPSSLRSLNLNGAQIVPERHLSHLIRLSRHVEELGLAHTNLSIGDLKSLILPEPSGASTPWIPSTLCYLDLTGVRSVTQPALFFDRGAFGSRVDADAMPPIPLLLSEASKPLEVLELGQSVINDLQRMGRSNSRFGWLVKELGRRGWYVRAAGSATDASDPAGGRARGERWWKMGCRSWGMKKVPMVDGEVGGLYGHYMFKK